MNDGTSAAGPLPSIPDVIMRDSDIILVFEDGTTLPAHSVTLGQHSTVLFTAVRLQSYKRDHDGKLRLPISGDMQAAWVEMLKFMYPVLPRAQVSWRNAETLFVLADKYDMPYIMDVVSSFLLDSVNTFSTTPGRLDSVASWMRLASTCGQKKVLNKCWTTVLQTRGMEVADMLDDISTQDLKALMVNTLKVMTDPTTCLCWKCSKNMDDAVARHFGTNGNRAK
eukprot:jgi/Chrzof1/13442/Cz07g33110.t1